MDFQKLVSSQWDRVTAIVFAAIGAICLLVGWIGISGTAFTAEQLPYIISGGIASIFFLGLGGTLWLSADLRDEWRKLDSIDDALRARPAAPPLTTHPIEVAPSETLVTNGNGHGRTATRRRPLKA